MRKVSGLVVLLVLCLPFATQGAEPQFSVDANVTFLSKYVGGLSGSTAFNDPVIQPMFTLTHNRTDFYTRGWASYSPRGGYNADAGDEVNWFLGFKREYAGFGFDAGVGYYDFAKLFKSKGDLYGIYLNTDFPKIVGVAPFLMLEGDGPIKDGEGGYLYRAGARYAFEIGKRPPLGIEASFAGHDGAYGARPEFISSARLSFFTTVNMGKFGISPQLNFQKRLGYSVDDGGLTKDEVWGGVNITYQF